MQYGHEPQLNLNRMGKAKDDDARACSRRRCPAHSCAGIHVGLFRLSGPGMTSMVSVPKDSIRSVAVD